MPAFLSCCVAHLPFDSPNTQRSSHCGDERRLRVPEEIRVSVAQVLGFSLMELDRL